MRGGKRQACGLLPRSGKATRSGAAKPRLQAAALQARLSNPVGTAVPTATIEVADSPQNPARADWRGALFLLEAKLRERSGSLR